MNLQTKLMISALGMCALPVAHAQSRYEAPARYEAPTRYEAAARYQPPVAAAAAQFKDFGRVVRVEPRTEQIRVPREECRTDYQQVPVQQQRSAGGAVIGGIAGALLGNQVGGGSGRAAATAAGAIAGAVVGDRVDNNGRQGNYVQEQAVRQCRTVDAYESRTDGYNVTYEYRGNNYTTVMNRDPGNRVRLRVSVEPEQY